MVSCRQQLDVQHADVERHVAHAEALEGQVAALEARLQAAEEQARDATSGLALAQMTAEQARADAKRCAQASSKPPVTAPSDVPSADLQGHCAPYFSFKALF